MGKKSILWIAAILVIILAGFCCFYFFEIKGKNNNPKNQTPSPGEQKYDSQKATYNMSGNLKAVSGSSFTLEDKTPKAPSKEAKEESSSPVIVEIQMANDGVVARGEKYITLRDLEIGEFLLLKTEQQDGKTIAREVFAFSETNK